MLVELISQFSTLNCGTLLIALLLKKMVIRFKSLAMLSICLSKLLLFDSSLTVYMAMLFVLVGFGYKISMVPFHYWTPDVYQGAPITVTAFLSVAPKVAGFAIMIRFFYTLFSGSNLDVNWPELIAIFSALTMTVGNILALK